MRGFGPDLGEALRKPQSRSTELSPNLPQTSRAPWLDDSVIRRSGRSLRRKRNLQIKGRGKLWNHPSLESESTSFVVLPKCITITCGKMSPHSQQPNPRTLIHGACSPGEIRLDSPGWQAPTGDSRHTRGSVRSGIHASESPKIPGVYLSTANTGLLCGLHLWQRALCKLFLSQS